MGLNFEKTLQNISLFIDMAKKRKKPQNYVMITFFKWKYLEEEEKQEAVKFWLEKGVSEISVFDGPISRAGNVKAIVSPLRKNKIYGCNSIWANEMLHILYNGDVVLCCMDWRRETVLGNVKNSSIEEIWNGERYKNFREFVTGITESPTNFICKRCEASVGE